MPAIFLALALHHTPAMGQTAPSLPSWWDTALEQAREEGYHLADIGLLNELAASEPDLLIIDARSDYEFEAGHIPGAVNVEFDLGDDSGLDQERKEAFLALLGPDTGRPVLIYCRSFR